MSKIVRVSITLVAVISMILTFSLIGCKEEAAQEEESVEEAVEEETVEEAEEEAVEEKEEEKTYKVGMLPKFTSDPYFVACENGAKEAAAELGIDLDYNGPVDASVEKQVEFIERWTQAKYDVIAVCANDPDALVPAMVAAQDAGIKVNTWHADTAPEGREVFLNQCGFRDMGVTLVEMMVDETGPAGNFLIVTAVLTAPNQNAWIEEMEKYIEEEYPNMIIDAILPGDEDLQKSHDVAYDYLQSHPETTGVWCVTGIAVPGVLEAVKELGLDGEVPVTGIGVPSLIRKYIKDGSLKQAALWNPIDGGYATMYMSMAQLEGNIDPTAGLDAGRLGTLEFTSDDTILQGPPFVFDIDNIDDFDF